eukprot:6177133-Pleurochrysis_carterae.AAC.2
MGGTVIMGAAIRSATWLVGLSIMGDVLATSSIAGSMRLPIPSGARPFSWCCSQLWVRIPLCAWLRALEAARLPSSSSRIADNDGIGPVGMDDLWISLLQTAGRLRLLDTSQKRRVAQFCAMLPLVSRFFQSTVLRHRHMKTKLQMRGINMYPRYSAAK